MTVKNTSQPTESSAIEAICVYCGSGSGLDPAYATAARALGKTFADAGIRLIYGGGSLGLMGAIAKSSLKHGGKVTGVIPTFLSEKEQMLRDVDELIVVDDMHERKMIMFERADAFVALPGGIGTLEELVEQLTWSQLGRHRKPIVIANIVGFWAPFLNLLRCMQDDTFIRNGLELNFHVADTIDEVLPTVRANAAPEAQTSGTTIADMF